MNKKNLFAVFFVLVFMFILVPRVNAAAIEPTKETTSNGATLVFANGTPITITEKDGNTLISWDGGSFEIESAKANNLSVFGGYHANDTKTTTSITMTGGTVRNVFGGGLHKSYVTKAEVKVTGGTIKSSVNGGGADLFNLTATNCSANGCSSIGSLELSKDINTAQTVVEETTVSVGGSVKTVPYGSEVNVFGGGESYSYTGNAHVSVSAGKWNYVITSGSNGYTKSSGLIVTGGEIGVIQGINRGYVDNAKLAVTGGTVGELYAAGHTTETNKTSVIKNVIVDINDNAKVGKVDRGVTQTSAGVKAPMANTSISLTYLEGTITDGSNIANDFNPITTKAYVIITIDGVAYKVEKGTTLADESFIESLKNKTGYTFKGFTDEAGNEFAEDAQINSAVALKTVFEEVLEQEQPKDVEKEEETNPETSDNIAMYVVLGVVGLATVTATSLKIKKMEN